MSYEKTRCYNCGHLSGTHKRYGKLTCYNPQYGILSCKCVKFIVVITPLLYSVDKKFIGMTCPYCGGKHLWKGGTITLKEGKKKQRYRCLRCNRAFIIPGKHFSIRSLHNYSQDERNMIKQKIIDLHNKDKGYIGTYDSTGNSRYTTREIAKKLNVGKSFVAKVVKQYEEEKTS